MVLALFSSLKTHKDYFSENISDSPIIGSKGNIEIYDCQNTSFTGSKITLSPIAMSNIRKVWTEGWSYENMSPLYIKVITFTRFIKKYIYDNLQLNSWNNNGANIIININYGTGGAYTAQWFKSEAVFGSGDQTRYYNIAGSIVSIAHEVFHGVSDTFAGFTRYGQNGAIDEHYSDVFAILMKQKFYQKSDWIVGNHVMRKKFDRKMIRSFKDPSEAAKWKGNGAYPVHYSYKTNCCHDDKHELCNILNKAFYLVAIRIGIDDAWKIWFTTLRGGYLDMHTCFKRFFESLLEIATYFDEQSLPNTNKYSQALVESFDLVGINHDIDYC